MTDKIEYRALIVEDEFLIAEGLRIQLEDLDIDVCGVADTAEEACRLAREYRPDVILMDVRLRDDDDGIEAASEIRRELGSRIIFLTGSREQATIDRIAGQQPEATLFKPVTSHQLRRILAGVASGVAGQA